MRSFLANVVLVPLVVTNRIEILLRLVTRGCSVLGHLATCTLRGRLNCGVDAPCELMRFVHVKTVVSLEFILADLERFLRGLKFVRS